MRKRSGDAQLVLQAGIEAALAERREERSRTGSKSATVRWIWAAGTVTR
jgi:hypothetical protein